MLLVTSDKMVFDYIKRRKMIHHHPRTKQFTDVSIAFILVGAFIMSYGAVSWIANYASGTEIVYFPMSKVIGGLIVMGIGYIILELELIRER